MCSNTEECVSAAECSRNHTNKLAPGEKTCQCLEGFIEHGATCSGLYVFNILKICIALKKGLRSGHAWYRALIRVILIAGPDTMENLPRTSCI